MSDTSGRSGSGSSASVALQSSLENRLRVLLDSRGSTLFRLTWKQRVTPSRRPICALRGSARHISDNDCSSWPTCQSMDGRGGGGQASRHFREKSPRNLDDTVMLTGWVSPTCNDATGSSYAYSRGDHDRPTLKLPGQALLASWATPAAKEAGGTVEQFLARKAKAVATGKRLGISLTSLSLQATLTVDSGPMLIGSSARTARPGRLNPAFSLWLMGIPVGWLWCVPEHNRKRKRRINTAEREH